MIRMYYSLYNHIIRFDMILMMTCLYTNEKKTDIFILQATAQTLQLSLHSLKSHQFVKYCIHNHTCCEFDMHSWHINSVDTNYNINVM